MDINKSTTVAFTGYPTSLITYFKNDPNLLTAISEKVEIIIRRLYQCGYTTFLSGMEEGFDTIASEAVLKLKQELPEIRLIAVIPFMEREPPQNYNPSTYHGTDKVIYTSDADHPKVIFMRNKYLFANCSHVVCYYDGQHGDTERVVNDAVRLKLPIVNIYEELSDYFISTSSAIK